MPLVLYVARLPGKCLFDRVFSNTSTPLGAEGRFAFLLASPPILCPCHTLLFVGSLSPSVAGVVASPSLYLESVLCYHSTYLLGSQGKAGRPGNKSGPWRVPRAAQTVEGTAGSCVLGSTEGKGVVNSATVWVAYMVRVQ